MLRQCLALPFSLIYYNFEMLKDLKEELNLTQTQQSAILQQLEEKHVADRAQQSAILQQLEEKHVVDTTQFKKLLKEKDVRLEEMNQIHSNQLKVRG